MMETSNARSSMAFVYSGALCGEWKRAHLYILATLQWMGEMAKSIVMCANRRIRAHALTRFGLDFDSNFFFFWNVQQ